MSLTVFSGALLGAGKDAMAQPTGDPLALLLAERVAQYSSSALPAGPFEIGLLSDGESRFVQVPVEAGRCYTVAAISEDAESDLDLHLYAGRVEVNSDTGPDRYPVVHWCNASFERVSLELRMYSGSGRYAYQVLADRPMAEGQDGSITGRLNALAQQVAEGLFPAVADRSAILGLDQESEFTLRFVSGHCYVILAVGSATSVDLDLLLLGPDRTLIDADEARDGQPVVRHCAGADGAGVYLLKVRMSEGYGEVGVRVLAD